MKKLTKLITLTTAALCLAGCNQNIGLGALNFKGVHVQLNESSEVQHYAIKSWHDAETGIEIKTDDHGSFFLCEGSYAMFTRTFCPICGEDVALN